MSNIAQPDRRYSDIAFDLAHLTLEPIEDQTFREQDVYLDGRAFRRCVFVGCSIVVEYGAFALIDCNVTANRIEFRGMARVVAQLQHGLDHQEHQPPRQPSDG